MAKKRTDEEVAEEYHKTRLKYPDLKPPADYVHCECSPELLEAVRRSMMMGCNLHSRRTSRGIRLAKERRARESENIIEEARPHKGRRAAILVFNELIDIAEKSG